jgi:hypothetical protein
VCFCRLHTVRQQYFQHLRQNRRDNRNQRTFATRSNHLLSALHLRNCLVKVGVGVCWSRKLFIDCANGS